MIAECRTCKCIFLFEKHESSRLPNNGGGSVYFAHCPESGCDGSGVFDTGYPGDTDQDRESNRGVRNCQSLLREAAGIPV